ncbi:hypothetical protein PSN45_004132 [Yamadazyma tenuis]|uniref:DUF1742-domain-containing protein n=1 Tax=Candida tenuis (strain ATCC 10573 / BCRC 21748 / CBS 615 / JCM 9827 / NBRC 10315 / NRRL Y-1498 / VKM Y-70) TaxID=590646 RepID=G3B4D8_CANTC|nr:DUF1742-domain-containing protein [Yamadazyma tenuis ATCC 10573]EGV63799.1 DUF1742-domain-containing protein [Yamadazyma tenuis ATCC 10573]WEJ96592.1 hypothetical protein PSN45_004132 [Yamadazyma tenuis]
MSVPFTNEYKLRQVADSQSKSCVICYKSSSSVLVTTNSVDFFYVCPSHLADEHFAVHSVNDAYNALVKEKDELVELVTQLKVKIEKNKPSVFAKLPGFSSSNEGDKDKDKDKTNTYETLTKEKEIHEKKLQQLDTDIANFKFKDYVLNNDIFRMRLKNYINKKINEKRLKDMHNPGFFPAAPTSKLGDDV